MLKLAALAVILALALSSAFAQETFAVRRARPEAARERTDRLAVNQRHEALVRGIQDRARVNSALAAGSTTSGITITCQQPIQIADWGLSGIVTLCDPFGIGQAIYRGTFYQSPNSVFTALSPFGGYLFGMDASGTLNVFTDQSSVGIADPNPKEYPGLAGTESLVPTTGNTVYSQDTQNGRLLQYNLTKEAASSQVNNLPWLGGGNIFQTTSQNGYLYTIDSGQDAVLTKPFGNLNPNPLLYGYRISAITVDEQGNLFALSSGNCHDMPSPSTGDSSGSCQASSIGMLVPPSILYPAPRLFAAPIDNRLDVYYSFQNTMFASNGRLYVVVLVMGSDGNYRQQILQYQYNVVKGGGVTISPPTLFAGPDMFSQYPFLTALTSFSGGNVTAPIQ